MTNQLTALIAEMEARGRKHKNDIETVPDKSLIKGAYCENQYVIQRLKQLLKEK